MPSDSSRDAMFLHPLNAEVPIDFTFPGIDKVFKLEQLVKAKLPIEDTDEGISMDSKLLQK